MFGIGLPEVIIIIAVVVVLFFGGKKITELARGMGRFSGEFKKGKMEIEKELKEEQDSDKINQSQKNEQK